MTLVAGTNRLRMDSQGRLIFPGPIKDALGSLAYIRKAYYDPEIDNTEDIINYLIGLEYKPTDYPFLEIYSETEFGILVKELKKNIEKKFPGREKIILRNISSLFAMMQITSSSRTTIQKEARQYALLKENSDVILICMLDVLELWSADVYEKIF